LPHFPSSARTGGVGAISEGESPPIFRIKVRSFSADPPIAKKKPDMAIHLAVVFMMARAISRELDHKPADMNVYGVTLKHHWSASRLSHTTERFA